MQNQAGSIQRDNDRPLNKRGKRDAPRMPADITNYLPIGIQIIRGKEHHIPIVSFLSINLLR